MPRAQSLDCYLGSPRCEYGLISAALDYITKRVYNKITVEPNAYWDEYKGFVMLCIQQYTVCCATNICVLYRSTD